MTQEDKNLLLRDLCARLPYGVKIKYHYKRENNVIDEVRELSFSDVETLKYNNEYPQDYWCEIFWKPYIRQMSNMTEDEHNDWFQYYHNAETEELNKSGDYFKAAMSGDNAKYDWLNAHHFDYRGMIEKGLALPAKEGMY